MLEKFGNFVIICLHPLITNMNDWLIGMSTLDKDDLSDISKILIICWQMWNDIINFVFKQIKPYPTRSLMVAASIGKDFLNAIMKQEPSKSKISVNTINWKAHA